MNRELVKAIIVLPGTVLVFVPLKGLGSQLVKHVFRKARELGSKKISIGIIARQTELKHWYQKIGFIEGATKEFSHLPFQVTFMTHEL
jgi:GNAT superfamily N-acetyltransferase